MQPIKEKKYREPQIKNIKHVHLTWSYWSLDMLKLHGGLKRPVSFCCLILHICNCIQQPLGSSILGIGFVELY